ncbi:MAG TPA: radical SAM protein [Armatimonadota bacterium]|nr:radical SAM protein [Armatimonadota bacterium]
MPTHEGTTLTDRFAHLIKRHPCLGVEGHFSNGRIHLPVSPACNIQCRFCKRSCNKTEERPGVSRTILAPHDAVDVVTRALALCPDITVAGIAGPGDTLATPQALETFRLIHRQFPHLILCMSTNGLCLPESAEDIVSAGVETLTVTVNAIDPYIQAQICRAIHYHGEDYTGERAAEILINAQLTGIKRLAELGVLIKINSVLVPGVNDGHIAEVARLTAAHGATMINIIPLIPQHEFAHIPVPSCDELNRVRHEAAQYLSVFRHCRQCRADACGIPGRGVDFAAQLYQHQEPMTFSHG